MKLRISLLFAVAMPIYSQFMLAQIQGEKSPEQVKVKVRQGSEVRGYVSKVGQDSFDVTEKTGKTVTIAYGDVVKVQKPGMSKGAKIGIAAGAIAFVIAGAVARAIASLGP